MRERFDVRLPHLLLVSIIASWVIAILTRVTLEQSFAILVGGILAIPVALKAREWSRIRKQPREPRKINLWAGLAIVILVSGIVYFSGHFSGRESWRQTQKPAEGECAEFQAIYNSVVDCNDPDALDEVIAHSTEVLLSGEDWTDYQIEALRSGDGFNIEAVRVARDRYNAARWQNMFEIMFTPEATIVAVGLVVAIVFFVSLVLSLWVNNWLAKFAGVGIAVLIAIPLINGWGIPIRMFFVTEGAQEEARFLIRFGIYWPLLALFGVTAIRSALNILEHPVHLYGVLAVADLPFVFLVGLLINNQVYQAGGGMSSSAGFLCFLIGWAIGKLIVTVVGETVVNITSAVLRGGN